MNGIVVVAIGLFLCFLGVGSAHLAVTASGFAIAWMLADNLDASSGTGLLIGLGGAATAWIVVSLILRTAGFFVGAVASGVIGAKLYTLLQGDESSAVLAVIFVLSTAVLGGFLAGRFRARVLLWLCAFGGAGIVLSGLATAVPSLGGWLHAPDKSAEAVVSGVAWVVIGVAGVVVQRRLFPRAAGRVVTSPG